MNLPKIIQAITGNSESFSLEHRVFNITAAGSVFVAVMALIQNIYLQLPLYLNVSIFIYMSVMITLYYLARFKGMLEPSVTAACIVLIIFFTPAAWILNSGINGGAHYPTMFYGMVICAICSGRKRTLLIFLLLIMVAGLGTFEYLYPEYIHYYENRMTRYIDVILSMLTTIIISILLFLAYLKNYDHERERVLTYSQLLEEMAVTDGLTGLFNHSYIHQLLEDKMTESIDDGAKLSVIMFDLDYFKNINDTFGHEFGNQVLFEVASSLKNSIRSTDLIGRYGGEEFLILCPAMEPAEAAAMAEWLLIEVENLVIGKGVSVTLSGGVACYDVESDTTAIDLIEKADKALYEAKRMGRNRIQKYDNV